MSAAACDSEMRWLPAASVKAAVVKRPQVFQSAVTGNESVWLAPSTDSVRVRTLCWPSAGTPLAYCSANW